MSIRIVALYIFVFSLCIYAWKDWFKSLCGLILLMAVIEHGDMPKSLLGIQGLNLWNVLFAVIFIAWLTNRRREGLIWDMPRHIAILLLMCIGVIVIGVVRAIFDRGEFQGYSTGNLISEELINTIKWVLPGLLLFDGCRSRKRVVIALVCLLVMYFLIAVQVVRYMPPEAAIGSNAYVIMHSRMGLNESVGYQATDLSVLLGGACWGLISSLPLIRKKIYKLPALVAICIVAFGQATTGGRAGYAAWAATGLLMCIIKWRKYLLLTPVIIVLLPIIFPNATARMLQGFGRTDISGETTVDEVTVLSGRNLFWPHVVDTIWESPVIGHGRRAMQRTGLTQFLLEKYGPHEAVEHPHNLYYETLLDNGILGSLPIFFLWGIIVCYSIRLFISKNHLCSAVGGLSLSLMLTSLISGIAGQHWAPLEHTLGIWASAFLTFRVYFEERKIRSCAMNDNYCDVSSQLPFVVTDSTHM